MSSSWKDQPVPSASERLLALGKPGSGKSVVLQILAAPINRIVAIDVKRGSIELPGAHYAYGVGKLDWDKPRQVWTPRDYTDQDELGEFYRQAYKQGNLTVWLDECYGPTDQNRFPKELATYLMHGRFRNLRHLAASQRPVGIAKPIRATADQIVIFARGMTDSDIRDLAGDIGISPKRLVAALAELHHTYGDFSHLHYVVKTNVIHLRPPAPEWAAKIAGLKF